MKKEAKFIRYYYYFLIVVLSLIMVTSLVWNINNEYKSAISYAKIEGEASYHKDLLFRKWATMHGGVYVPTSEKTKPNPLLDFIEDRDITTPNGKKLTLINPAYIIRQLFEMEEELVGVKGHINSLRPIRLDNYPDQWETEALNNFHKGSSSVSELVEANGNKFMRFMSPLVIDKKCMKCHSHQGYNIGDIKGGISVSVPMDKYYKVSYAQTRKIIWAHIAIYLISILFSVLGYKRIIKEMRRNHIMQRRLVTNELSLKSQNEELNLAIEKAKEAELHLLVKNEETEIAYKSLKKVNEQLQKAKEQAEESDRLKTAFLQNMSHEIRTPLNAICGFAGMLNLPDIEKDQSQAYANIIQNSSDQLLSIVSDVLTISALETEQEKVYVDRVNINRRLDDLFVIFNEQAKKRNIKLKLNKTLSDTSSEVFTDKTKFVQIFTNLLTNAFKFTKEGHVEYGYIRKEKVLEFYVKDSGVGIEPQLQGIIFERFRQADLSLHRSVGGNGLGLSISMGFAKLLGGTIWVESEQGKGACFYFTIPYKSAMSVSESCRN